MPNNSFIDINYIIKEENESNEESNELIIDKNFFSDKINNFKNKDVKIDLNLMKGSSTKINNKKLDKNEKFLQKKFNTPGVKRKISSNVPKNFQLNPLEEEENNDDLTQKIFSKIFNKFPKESLNSSIEVIESKEINDNEEENKEGDIKSKNMDNYETFCLGIFISGLKSIVDKKSIIDNSYNFISSCGHKNCSLLLSFKPELISTYSNKNSPITQELNYLVANLCFPLGIKICFEDLGDNKDKKSIQKVHNIYYNVIKNAKDDIFYIVTLQYFIKMAMKNFKDIYRFDINSYYTQINNQDNKDKNLKKSLSLINGLKENDIIYVPESISLLSKYPFFIPMNYCLNNIISLPNQEDKTNLINHIINEVPVPQKLRQIQFYIPLYKSPLILNHYYNIFKGLSKMSNSIENNNIIDNLSISQLNSKTLLEKISIENIIILFQLVLLEQQILIIDNNYQSLSEIILILISLIYPLVWTNPFLPILSLNTVQFLQTPVPYIMGLDEYLLNYAYNSKNIYVGKEIIMYNLMSKNFVLSRTRKKANKREIMNEFKLNFLPEKIEDFMILELKKIKMALDDNKYNDIELDMKIRLVFLKTMICLIGDYNNFTFYKNNDDMPLFNTEAFIESHKEKQIKLFYGQMTKTQLFKQFLLNERQLYFYNNKNNINDNMNNEENILDENFDINNCVDTSYFKKMIQKYPELINNEEIRKSSLNDDIKKNKREDIMNMKKSRSNKNIKLNFDIKKDSMNSLDVYNTPITIKESKLTIDFNQVSLNSPEIINLTKSHNFNFQGKIDNKIDNDSNIRKSMTNKYNNIIIKKTNKIRKYLLYPYFLPKLKKEESKLKTPKIINDKVLEFFQKNNYQIIPTNLKNKLYILEKPLNYNLIQIKNKHYYIIEQNTHIISNENIHNNLTDKNDYMIYDIKSSAIKERTSSKIKSKRDKKSKVNKKKEENKLKIKEINNKQNIEPKYNLIKNPELSKNVELIDKCIRSCYTNKQRVTNEQFLSLEKIFSNSYNKSYFAKLLVPDMRIKNKNQHKQLISTSFEDLKAIMKMCLEKLTHEENEIGRLLTIACFSYYKIDKDNNIFYLYQSFIQGVVYPCKLWLIDDFWIEFFRIEMSEASNKEDELIKNYDINNMAEFSDNDRSVIEFKSKYSILKENSLYVSRIMYKLNLNQIFIVKVFEKMILPVYECDYYNINNIMKDILSLFDNN